MGRITVFSSVDLHSQRTKGALEKREIPYVEICLADHPSRVSDLSELSEGNVSVPQVFVNDRLIGGVKETLHELRLWDKDDRYACALEKFEMEIESRPTANDDDPRLFASPVPHQSSVGILANEEVPLALQALRHPKAYIPLPDGSSATYAEIMEKLRNVLTVSDVVHKGTMYKKCFAGKSVLVTLQMAMNLTPAEALRFANLLVELKVIRPISSADNGRQVSDRALYRLQCDMTPDVLNSYKLWTAEPVAHDPLKLADALDEMLRALELGSLNSRGKVDYSQLVLEETYPAFEEAVCSLQRVDLSTLSCENAQVAFAINVHKLMLRYALCKVGFFANEEDRVHFLKKVQFQVGPTAYSFHNFLHAVLQFDGRAPSRSLRPSFNGMERRRKVSHGKMDWRVYFACYSDALLGNKFSTPFKTFSWDNLDAELDMASRIYLRDKAVLTLDPVRNLVKLSKVFQWYQKEYGSNRKALLASIAEFLPDPSAMKQVTRIKFMNVAWTANAINYARYTKESVVGQFTAVGHMLLGRFKPPPTPSNEKLRIATLRSLNILDTPSDERINRITAMVQSELKVPLVFVTLVDATRQWFKSVQWECNLPQPQETTRDLSFCGHAILDPSADIMYVENALEDDRFADNPFVTGELGVRFYAGVPLSFPTGRGVNVNIGTLCAIDIQPRKFSARELDRLRHYAMLVKQEILRLDDSSDDMGSACSTESVESNDFVDEVSVDDVYNTIHGASGR